MRNTIIRNTLIGLFAFGAFAAHSQNVGINTTGANANASAILDLNTGNSGHVGFLAPQASLSSITDIATIPGPVAGLIVYNTNAATGNGVGYYYWNGADWIIISGTAGDWLLTGNSGSNPATNWIGTNDANALQIKVDGTKSGWIDYLGTAANTFLGFKAGNVTTGANNLALGYLALELNTTGASNTAVGYSALINNTTAAANTATGYDALYFNNTGGSNTANGYQSLNNNTTGSNNTAIGLNAIQANSTANGGTAFGSFALQNSTFGFNTAVGFQAGQANTLGQSNTYVGAVANANAGTYTNSTAIGANTFIGASNVMQLGAVNGLNSGIADVNVGIGTNVPTQKLQVNNGNILISQGAIGGDAAAVGALQLQGTSTGISSIQAGAQGATTYNYILPTNAPSAGNVMDVTSVVGNTVSLGWQVEPNALLKVIVVTSTQVATLFDAGTTYILYKVIGGGGAGGGCKFTAPGCISSTGTAGDMAGAGGGAGEYVEGFITGITGGVSTYQVIIGAGGVGQATCGAPVAGNGGETELITVGPAATIQAEGGKCGPTIEMTETADNNAYFRQVGGAGGSVFVNANAVNIPGATGGYGSITGTGIHACEAGPGANSYFEGGGSQFEERDVQSCPGNPASAYGSGGGGATYADLTTVNATATGGDGSPGIVIIYEYK